MRRLNIVKLEDAITTKIIYKNVITLEFKKKLGENNSIDLDQATKIIIGTTINIKTIA